MPSLCELLLKHSARVAQPATASIELWLEAGRRQCAQRTGMRIGEGWRIGKRKQIVRVSAVNVLVKDAFSTSRIRVQVPRTYKTSRQHGPAVIPAPGRQKQGTQRTD